MASVLVVEDEPLIAMMIEEWLEELGHQSIGPAASVREGLKLLETRDFDAALLDVNLGDERSDAIADILAARNIPFALMTGGMTDALIERFSSKPHLMKPFNFERVSEIVDALTKGS